MTGVDVVGLAACGVLAVLLLVGIALVGKAIQDCFNEGNNDD